ncbi:hypothetical protein HC752_07385 [Vibrio sp. S9_S30]|uniref:hypothetical protein n=1 Tax=Vibrio sp. S9_S30 TaxID=2720226 RepID=UPI0016815BE5|nr:hypothetical protein [Vibrio sp. S9_S30]MBD1556755.1 hypothetical protein [Vibrio sp. S9_S30]
MKRIPLSIASAGIGLIALFAGLFMAVFIGIVALIMGRRFEQNMAKNHFQYYGSAVHYSTIIEGEYDDITSK